MNNEINEDSSDDDISHVPAQKSKKKLILSDSEEGEATPSIDAKNNEDKDLEDSQPQPERRVKKKQNRNVFSSDSDPSGSESGSEYFPSEQSDSDDKENGSTPPLSRKSGTAVVTPEAASSRRSSRLKSREDTRSSFTTPDRRKYLEEVSPSLRSDAKRDSGIRKKLYSNNLVLGRNTYNSERSYEKIEYSDASDDGFIVEDEEEEEEEDDDEEPIKKKRRKKEPKKKKKKRMEVRESSDDEVEKEKEECDADVGTPLSTRTPVTERRASRRRDKEKDPLLQLLAERRKGKKVDFPKSEESSDESPISALHNIFNRPQQNNSDDDFIVDDEVDDDSGTALGENFEEELKDVKNLFERKSTGKSLEKVLRAPTIIKHESQSSSSDDDLQGDEPFLTKDDEMFMDIIYQNDIVAVESFIKGHKDALDKCLTGNRTALHLAAFHGHKDMVRLLLRFSAKTSIKDSLHYTPLGYATKNKHAECLRDLLDKSDVAEFSRHLHKNFEGKNLLHFLIDSTLEDDSLDGNALRDIEDDIVKCLDVVKQFKVKMYRRLLDQVDADGNTPLRHAVAQDHRKVLDYFLNEMSAELVTKELQFKTYPQEGNLLHFAVLSKSPRCLEALITKFVGRIDEADNSGFTPLMYAAEIPECDDCLELLLNFNASVHVKDEDGVTPLHLSASCGNLRSIQLLLDHGHKVDCVDRHGWPPLLYANFRASEECVITLMEKNPKQIFCLGNLITRSGNEEIRKKNLKVIQDTLVCISQVDRYYTIFNDFIGHNLNILDENDHGCFTKTWRMILSFKNKVKWMRLKSRRCRHVSYGRLQIDRSNVMGCALEQLPQSFNFTLLDVRFVGEEGTCLGPKREFCSLFVQELCSSDRKLFIKADGEQYYPTPNAHFLKHMKRSPSSYFKEPSADKSKTATFVAGINFQDDALDEALLTVDTDANAMEMSDDMLAAVDLGGGGPAGSSKWKGMKTLLEYEGMLEQRLKLMRLVGQFSANVVVDEEIFVKLQFSKPFVKQILGMELNHPADLADQDHQTYSSIKNNPINDLGVIFCVGTINPWTGELEETLLGGRCEEVEVTEENKDDYLTELSEFKLRTSISEELRMFREGFYDVIGKDIISIFNADEFSLLLNGIAEIDIQDWKKNTQLIGGWSWSSPEIEWFWEVVSDLKEEEKSLLLKFSTGSPCVPVGGFAKLRGLSGSNLFTISTSIGNDKLPEAATCFNLVRLGQYSNKMLLREKLLIAIRHGCEGFTMG